MADRRRNRSENRPARPAPLTGEIAVDGETAAALALFNARLTKQAEGERAQRRVDRAQKDKDQAAARVRELENDTKATAEKRAEATEAYKASLQVLERAKNGETEPAAPAEAEAGAEVEREDKGEPADASVDEATAADS